MHRSHRQKVRGAIPGLLDSSAVDLEESERLGRENLHTLMGRDDRSLDPRPVCVGGHSVTNVSTHATTAEPSRSLIRLRLISTGNSVPSRRLARRFSPMPMDRISCPAW